MRKTKVLAGVLAVALSAGILMPAVTNAASDYFAAPDGKTVAKNTEAAANGAYDEWEEKWAEISSDWTQVSMTPGENETQRNFAWYSKETEAVSFKYGKMADLSDAVEVKPEQTVTGQKDQEGTVYVSNKAVIKDLEKNTTYYYQVDNKEIESFQTQDSSDFQFIFVGDPQIGSSNDKKAKKPENLNAEFYAAQYAAVENDTFNWNFTLKQALKKSQEKASFVLSAGDQIQTNAKKVADTAVSEIEYAGYLSPDVLKKLPVATTVGNHDADNANYLYHFNLPNLSDLGSNDVVGGDYSFTYGDALFIMLNTQDTNIAEHKIFIENAVKENPDCTWRVVTLHQDIYGSAEHSNEPEIINLRYALVPIFQENDIDLVLTGHDHAYSRSELLKDGVKEITYTDDEFDEEFEKDIDVTEDGKNQSLTVSPGNISADTTDEKEKAYMEYLNTIMDEDAVVEGTKGEETVTDAEGILYLTAGSSSGSKYYDLVARKQTYVAARWQEDVPTYSLINISKDTLTINSYRTDTNEPIDSQVTLKKTQKEEQKKAENQDTDKKEPETQNNTNTTIKASKTADLNPVNSLTLMMILSICVMAAAIVIVFMHKENQKGQLEKDNLNREQ